LNDLMRRLLVGFDSAWTAGNAGGLVGVLFGNECDYQDLGPPIPANFVQAEEQIREWQTAYGPSETILLIDQPTIVRNPQGQRPVENLVSSPVSLRYGGMQPANTGRKGMFDVDAPIWAFLRGFGGPTNPLSPTNSTNVFETYPVLTIIAMDWTLPEQRPKGRLPKYNPARRKTFQQDDWRYLCMKIAEQFEKPGLEKIKTWIDSRADPTPTKDDQDCLDACLCLLVAMKIAKGEPCLVVGQPDSGAIVVPHSDSLAEELATRCRQTGREPKDWVKKVSLEKATNPGLDIVYPENPD
jgi:predicted RNase H-like nuclease